MKDWIRRRESCGAFDSVVSRDVDPRSSRVYPEPDAGPGKIK